jgi:hypothetical protein
MSAPLFCEPRCCPTTTTATTGSPGAPGAAGADGADGSDGLNAFTITTEDFVVPAIGANVTITVDDSVWAVPGQNVFVEGAGYFEVVSKPSITTMQLEYLDYEGNTHATDNISAGAQVSPSGTHRWT